MRNTRSEHFTSDVPSVTDIARTSRNVRVVPITDCPLSSLALAHQLLRAEERSGIHAAPQPRNLPRAGGKPLLDHGETIAAPKWFAIDENPGRTEHPTGNDGFAMLARDGFDLGIVYACQH
jgi:hypothetical protein